MYADKYSDRLYEKLLEKGIIPFDRKFCESDNIRST
jgi:hypothetical protein